MRHRSSKKEAEYKLRRPLVERLLAERPYCEACAIFAEFDGRASFNHRRSTEINEIIRRSQGGSILDESNLMALCHFCHQRITEYRDGKETLTQLGLYKPGWMRDQRP